MGTIDPGAIPGSHSPRVELVVASVGPYALNIIRPEAYRATSSGETRSVPASSVAVAGSWMSGGIESSRAGGRIMNVMPCALA